MLKRFKKKFKKNERLQQMVLVSNGLLKEEDVGKKNVKETLLDDIWRQKVDYILSFTTLIYDVLRKTNTNATSLHLINQMLDSMIEKVRKVIH